MTISREDPRFWDSRTIERRIRKGLVSRADLAKHLKSLDDSKDRIAPVEEDERGRSRLPGQRAPNRVEDRDDQPVAGPVPDRHLPRSARTLKCDAVDARKLTDHRLRVLLLGQPYFQWLFHGNVRNERRVQKDTL